MTYVTWDLRWSVIYEIEGLVYQKIDFLNQTPPPVANQKVARPGSGTNSSADMIFN